jgi:hypothetical protein
LYSFGAWNLDFGFYFGAWVLELGALYFGFMV